MSDVTFIQANGVPQYAVLPIAEYQMMLAALDDQANAEKIEAAEAAEIINIMETEESIPSDVAEKLMLDETPIQAWREYRGIKQKELADRAGISKGHMNNLEKGRCIGSISVLSSIAKTLNIKLEMLSQ